MSRSVDMRAAAEAVVARLRQDGHEAYFAGGSVRDLVLGTAPHDFDVATSARPEQVLALFERTVAVGVAFGVIIVLEGPFEVEVATFRADGAYLDGRHPSAVHFSTAEQDVARRDFTINGLLYDPELDQVIDYVDGQADLEARVVRCIGDPDGRFGEDRLRMLRAVRFAVRFDFAIEPATWQALQRLAPHIGEVSAERIRDELLKMLTGPTPDRALQRLHDAGLLQQVLPEVAALQGVEQPPEFHPEGDVFEHTLRALAALELPGGERPAWADEALWLATLLHDVGKPETQTETDRVRFHGHEAAGARRAEAICRRLRLSNHHLQRVRDLVGDHMRLLPVQQMRQATRLRLLRLPYIDDLLALHRADRLAGSGDLTQYDYCRAQLDTLPPEVLRPARLLDGNDLKQRGVAPGPDLGRLLEALEDAQLEGEVVDRAGAHAWLTCRLAEDKTENKE